MIKDSFRTLVATPTETAIIASFAERFIDNADGTRTKLEAASSVHTFAPLSAKHELHSICPKTQMSSFSVSKPDSNFMPMRFDYLVPNEELASFLSSAYVTSESRAIQVVKRFADKFLIQLQSYSDTVYPNFVIKNQNDKSSAIQFLAALPVEPIVAVETLPQDTTKKKTIAPTVVAPSNIATLSNEELLAMLQNPAS